MVGFGAQLGASFPQWKALIDGLGNIEKTQDRKELVRVKIAKATSSRKARFYSINFSL